VCSAARLAARGTDQGKVPRHTSIRLEFAIPGHSSRVFQGLLSLSIANSGEMVLKLQNKTSLNSFDFGQRLPVLTGGC
jgi:hypothetical protein